jgi:hypothetical protein
MVICNGTFPPDFFSATWGNFPRRQIAVFRWMPLLGKLGMINRKAIGFGGPVAAAIRAAGALGSAVYRSLPFMVLRRRAFPPDFSMAASAHVFRSKVTILRRMPLYQQVMMRRRKAIRLVNLLVCAIGTTPPECPVADSGFPLVAGLAPPPDLSIAARRDF